MHTTLKRERLKSMEEFKRKAPEDAFKKKKSVSGDF